MAVLDWSTFTVGEWADCSVDEWSTFIIAPLLPYDPESYLIEASGWYVGSWRGGHFSGDAAAKGKT